MRPSFPQRSLLLASAVACLATVAGCGSSPSKTDEDPAAPAWTRQPSRTVDGGYIVYVGNGEDRSAENARTKAEGVAMADLANECSFAPKGSRIEDRYERLHGILHKAFVKVAVDFASCEEAKSAVKPEDIRRLANASITEDIERYHDLVDEEEETDQNGTPISPETQAMLAQTQTPGSSTSVGPGGVRWVVVQSEPSFWIMREQVAYAKQTVILAPPTQYQPGTPQSQQFASQVSGPVQQVHGFETAHPEMRSSSATWSGYQQQAAAERARAQAANRRASHAKRAGGQGGHPGGKGHGGGGHHRRRPPH